MKSTPHAGTVAKPELHAGWHGVPAVPMADRLSSLDAFRGFVIIAMVFVNNLGEGVPWWMRHASEAFPNTFDAYTFVDLVFPGFLFMVGLSLPLSFYSKIKQGVNEHLLFWRAIARAAMLLFIGGVMVNHGYDEQLVGMSKAWWHTYFYASIMIVNLATPKHWGETAAKILGFLKFASWVVIAWMLIIYRASGPDGQVMWFQRSWWGILGLIGWAYLGAALIYLVLQGDRMKLIFSLVPLMALDMLGRHGVLNGLNIWPEFNDAFGTHTLIVVSGAVVGSLFVGSRQATHDSRMRFILAFGTALYALGTILRPMEGINKNAATIPWGLVSVGICCALFVLFYWLIEVLQHKHWADWLNPVGQNALLAYIFSNVNQDFYKAFTGTPMPYWGTYLNAVQQILLVCIFAWVCTRLKLFMRL